MQIQKKKIRNNFLCQRYSQGVCRPTCGRACTRQKDKIKEKFSDNYAG